MVQQDALVNFSDHKSPCCDENQPNMIMIKFALSSYILFSKLLFVSQKQSVARKIKKQRWWKNKFSSLDQNGWSTDVEIPDWPPLFSLLSPLTSLPNGLENQLIVD